MESYRLLVRPAVHRDVKHIPGLVLQRIMNAMRSLAENPLPRGASKLHGSENTFRIRVGDYRIIYDVDRAERVVNILHVAHRRDVYRKY